jgi:hypothetical protein
MSSLFWDETADFLGLFFEKILPWLFIIVLTASVFWLNSQRNQQQRQIDQLCEGVFQLVAEQGAQEQSGFTMGKEYCLFLADFRRGRALLGEFDGEISYDKKARLVIMPAVDEKTLDDWVKQPVIFGRYRKIR